MNNIKDTVIGLAMVVFGGAALLWLHFFLVDQEGVKQYARGYAEGQLALKPVSATSETTSHATVQDLRPAKPIPSPPVQRPRPVLPSSPIVADSATVAFINELVVENDTLRERNARLNVPVEMFIGDDSGNYAIVSYFPPTGLYDGTIYAQRITVTLEKISVPQPTEAVAVDPEQWYLHPALYIAGGATSAAVIVLGGGRPGSDRSCCYYGRHNGGLVTQTKHMVGQRARFGGLFIL
jgi:hypothetical protein